MCVIEYHSINLDCVIFVLIIMCDKAIINNNNDCVKECLTRQPPQLKSNLLNKSEVDVLCR